MWRRLFGGGDAKNTPLSAERRARDESPRDSGREAQADADDDDEDPEDIPFDVDELPELGDEMETSADVHAGPDPDPEHADGIDAGAHAPDVSRADAAPRVRIHNTAAILTHLEEVSPFAERPALAREDYEMLVGELPMPRKRQMRAFAEYVSSAKSWYKHLPLLPPGAAFYFYLDPFSGMERVLMPDGTAVFIPRDADAEGFHYSWMPTVEYRERFGFLAFACAEGSRFIRPVRVEADDVAIDGVLDNNFNHTVVWVPRKPFQLPDAILKTGTCTLTGVVHPQAACPAVWRSTLENTKSDHAWPVETGGPATLTRIRARAGRTAFADAVDAELEALIVPERKRLLDGMVLAMTRMVEQLHGSL